MNYALVHNNQIKVGPREYHSGFFQNYLNSINLNLEVPYSEPTNGSICLNDEIYIVPVENVPIPNYHPITEQLSGPFYNVNTTSITGVYGIADVELDAAKNSLKQLITNLRYQKENTIIKVTIQNTEVSVKTYRGLDRDFFIQSYLLMGDNDTKLVKFPIENVWLTLSKADFGAIVTEINTVVQNAFDWENQQIQIIESSDKTSLENQYNTLIE